MNIAPEVVHVVVILNATFILNTVVFVKASQTFCNSEFLLEFCRVFTHKFLSIDWFQIVE